MTEEKIKVAFIGQASAGKTALITRMAKNYFDEERNSTIGVQESKLQVNFEDQDFILDLLDTAGQERYAEITDFYIKSCDIAIVCFDPLLDKAEDQLKFWKNFIDRYLPKNKQILVSTKSDLWSNSSPLPELVKNPNSLPGKYNTSFYIETSSLNGKNINDLINEICHTYLESKQSGDSVETLQPAENTDKSCRC